MSIRLISQVWDKETPLTGHELMVALVLADHANDRGLCWPSVKVIAEKARISTRTVQRTLHRFVQIGLLVIDRQGRGRGITTRYIFNLHEWLEQKVSSSVTFSPPEAGKGDTTDQKGDTTDQKGDKLVLKTGQPLEPLEPNTANPSFVSGRTDDPKTPPAPAPPGRSFAQLMDPEYRPPALRDAVPARPAAKPSGAAAKKAAPTGPARNGGLVP